VVVNGYSEDLFGPLLPDNIFVQSGLYLVRLEKTARYTLALLPLPLLGYNIGAKVNALVADIDGGASDKFAHLILRLAAEGASQDPGIFISGVTHLISLRIIPLFR
jgi:hypothetical protein